MLTSTVQGKVGVIAVVIDDAGATATFEILSIARVEYDFGITEEDQDVDQVSVFYSKMTIDANYRDSLDNDLYDRLTDISESVSLVMKVPARGWSFRYVITPKDIKINELERTVTINATPDLDLEATMGEYLFPGGFIYRRGEGEGYVYTASSVGRFIQNYLSRMNPDLGNLVSSAPAVSENVSDPLFKDFDANDFAEEDGNDVLALVDLSDDDFEELDDRTVQEFTQLEVMLSIAASEGSIFGTGFDRNFYIWRIDGANPVTVDWNDVKVFESPERIGVFRRISVVTNQTYIDPIIRQLPYLGLADGLHRTTNFLNSARGKSFEFTSGPGFPFVNSGEVDDSAATVLINVYMPALTEDFLRVEMQYLGHSSFTAEFLISNVNPNTAGTNMANAINSSVIGSDWSASVASYGSQFPGFSETNPSWFTVELQYIGAGDGLGYYFSLEFTEPDHKSTYEVNPNPSETGQILGSSSTGQAAADLREQAVKSYSTAFPAETTFRIAGEIFGFVKPWQPFTFSNAPSRYAGKVFRLSKAGYDLILEKMTFKAFEIDIGDIYWDFVISLLSFNDDIEDDKGNTWTAENGAAIEQGVSAVGGSSLLLDGTDQYLTGENDAKFDLGAGDFTIEFFMNTDVASETRYILRRPNSGGYTSGGWILLQSSTDEIFFQFSTGSSEVFFSGGSLSVDTWHHIAVTAENNFFRVFIDGQIVDSGESTATRGAGNLEMEIGRDRQNAARYFDGNLEQFRFTKGVARYTANFTPPTEPFEARK